MSRPNSYGNGGNVRQYGGSTTTNSNSSPTNSREIRTLDLRLRASPKKSVSPLRPQAPSGDASPVSNSSFSSGSPTWARRNSAKQQQQQQQQSQGTTATSSPKAKSFHLPPQSGQIQQGSPSSNGSGGGLSSMLTQAGSAGSMLPPAGNNSSFSGLPSQGTKRSNSLASLPRANGAGSGNSPSNNSFGNTSNSFVSSTHSNSASSDADVDQSCGGFQAPKSISVGTKNKLRKIRSQALNLSPCRGLAESMLPPQKPEHRNKNLLVLDIDETLVHASFTPETKHDVKITITVGSETGHIYVAFRPHMMTFLTAVAPLFEVAIFTASQSCYAQQLMDHIDPGQKMLGSQRLFREHCTQVDGARVKDLSLLGRPLEKLTIVDNSPVAYLFQQRNAIPILSWFDDPNDTELLKLIPFLKQLAEERSVYDMLDHYNAGAL